MVQLRGRAIRCCYLSMLTSRIPYTSKDNKITANDNNEIDKCDRLRLHEIPLYHKGQGMPFSEVDNFRVIEPKLRRSRQD